MRWTTAHSESLSCSFCHKSQDVVAKLASSPGNYPRGYICDECIAMCATITEADRNSADAGNVSSDSSSDSSEEAHPLLKHPRGFPVPRIRRALGKSRVIGWRCG
jgi:hypothetical protein